MLKSCSVKPNKLNCTFSAEFSTHQYLGALPLALIEVAPLALNTYPQNATLILQIPAHRVAQPPPLGLGQAKESDVYRKHSLTRRAGRIDRVKLLRRKLQVLERIHVLDDLLYVGCAD